MKKQTLRLTYAAVCLALALVLPFLTGQIPHIGRALSPMHIPVFLCGFICGWPYGMTIGFIAPILRSLLFGMPSPMIPSGIGMAVELMTYGFLSGLFYKLFPKKAIHVYSSLILAMIGGRVVWGVTRFVLARLLHVEFPFSAFLAGAVTEAIPGIVLHIVLIPVIVLALQKAKLIPEMAYE